MKFTKDGVGAAKSDKLVLGSIRKCKRVYEQKHCKL